MWFMLLMHQCAEHDKCSTNSEIHFTEIASRAIQSHWQQRMHTSANQATSFVCLLHHDAEAAYIQTQQCLQDTNSIKRLIQGSGLVIEATIYSRDTWANDVPLLLGGSIVMNTTAIIVRNVVHTLRFVCIALEVVQELAMHVSLLLLLFMCMLFFAKLS